MIVSKTPFRISLFGGGTDFPEYYNKYGGEVIGGSIDKYCFITLRDLQKMQSHKFEVHYSKIEKTKKIQDIEHPVIKACYKTFNVKPYINLIYDADMPAKSGLGTSSSFTVGLINALYFKQKNKKLSKMKLLEKSIFLEKYFLKEAVGCQDQTFAAYGGFNKINFSKKRIDVKKINLSKTFKSKMEENFFLIYTNNPRFAFKIEKQKIKRISVNINNLEQIKILTKQAYSIFNNNKNIDDIGYYLKEYWELKKKLSSGVTDNFIDRIYKQGIESGATGGKILGAGGGGFFLFYCKKQNHKKFLRKMNKFYISKFKFTDEGSKIIHSKA